MSLTDTGFRSEEKRAAVLKARALYEDHVERLNTEYVHLKDEKNMIEEELNEIRTRIASLEKERILYPKEAEHARDVIRREFDKRGIHGEVRFFSELVAEITNPAWQKAIETFLGNKRFNIIVDEKNCYTAMQIVKEARLYHSRVVLADRLPDTNIVEGSAAELLTIPNKAARNYANYLLNGIHLCKDMEELHDHPQGGITVDGMLAKSFSVTLMDMRRTVPCMGRDAVKAQLKQAGRELEEIKNRQKKCIKEFRDKESRKKSFADIRLNPEEYDFACPDTLKVLSADKEAKEKEVEKIRSDPSFAAALEEQAAAEEELKKVRKKKDKNSERMGANTNNTSSLNENIAAFMRKIKNDRLEYEQQILEHEEMRSRVEQEYLRLRKDNGEAVSYQNLNSVQNNMKQACDAMEQAQLEYCHITGTDTLRRGPSFIPYYRKELRDTSNVKIEEVKEQLNAKSKELESAFMIDFVGEINESILKADEEMNLINSELRKLPFGSDTYKFIKKEKPDRAMFFRIKKKLHDYMDNPEAYMSSSRDDEEMEQYIREYMDIIIEEENEDEYTDYRKYFTYDMVITSKQGDETVEANLSKKQGSASNGEKQTPYFIILAASLMQFYHEKCCERLAFIDEAFSALSGERIDQMVKYLEENHFQVIYAAPPEKIGSIGEHVSSTVSLVLTGRHTQAVEGIIR
jgi:chromosome segregation ATPase